MDKSSMFEFINGISLGMEFDRFSLNFEDPDNFVYHIDGKIFYSTDDDSEEVDSEKEEIIGAFRLLFIDATSASENGLSLSDVYNCDGEANEFFEDAINLENEEFNSKMTRLLEDDINFLGNNVLLIDRIGILPEFRGHHLGLLVLRKLIQRFYHSVSVVAIKPSPFEFTSNHIKQFDVDWQSVEMSEDSEEVKELGKYYEKIGFKKLDDSAFMVLGTARKFPILKLT
jgi:hypothetical protein